MSKERARRRAEREKEAAIRTAARAATAERRERRQARRRSLHAATVAHVPSLAAPGRSRGILDRRSRQQTTGLAAVLVLLNIVVWVVRGDWPAVLGALVVSLLVFPVLRVLLFARH